MKDISRLFYLGLFVFAPALRAQDTPVLDNTNNDEVVEKAKKDAEESVANLEKNKQKLDEAAQAGESLREKLKESFSKSKGGGSKDSGNSDKEAGGAGAPAGTTTGTGHGKADENGEAMAPRKDGSTGYYAESKDPSEVMGPKEAYRKQNFKGPAESNLNWEEISARRRARSDAPFELGSDALNEFKDVNCENGQFPQNSLQFMLEAGRNRLEQEGNPSAERCRMVGAQVAKLAGMAEGESSFNFSCLTLHGSEKESGRAGFRSVYTPDNKRWQMSSYASYKNALSEFGGSVNHTTNNGVMQISPDQFIRKGATELLDFYSSGSPDEILKKCGTGRAFHDSADALAGEIEELAGRRTLMFKERNGQKIYTNFARSARDVSRWLTICPALNFAMAQIILDDYGYSGGDSSKIRAYFGTAAKKPRCEQVIQQALCGSSGQLASN